MKKAYSILLILLLYGFLIIPIASASTFDTKLPQLLANERNTIDIFKKFSPLVVNVHRLQTIVTPQFDRFQVQSGGGSGFLWDKKGHVVTNYHVVNGARTIVVTLQSGKSMWAKIVGVAPRKEIAVLKIKPQDLHYLNNHGTIPIADSAKLQVGQKTIAIGNPYGLDHTVTTGIISALGRRIQGIVGIQIHDMIQTDASINPGNSGGPLLNSSGKLIGMNTAIYSNSGASAGIGFAVPSNIIKYIVPQIIENGRVIQPGLGIQRIDDRFAEQLGVDGVIIGEVIPDSPASKAGLRGTWRDRYGKIHFGDIIVGINSKRIKNADDLYNALENLKLGDEITLTYRRQDKKKTARLHLADITKK